MGVRQRCDLSKLTAFTPVRYYQTHLLADQLLKGNTMTDSRERRWLKKYYTALEGAVVTKVEIHKDDTFGYPQLWPRFTMKSADGEVFVVELSCDPEGNGPGFMFGLPEVTVK